MNDEITPLPSPKDADIDALMFKLLEKGHNKYTSEVGRDVNEVVSAMMLYSANTAGPSMARVACWLRDDGPIIGRDWLFETAPTSDPSNVAFTATKEGEDGGLLYFIRLEKEVSQKYRDLEAARQGIAYQKAREEGTGLGSIVVASIRGAFKNEADMASPDYYAQPTPNTPINEITVCAFSRDGKIPSFFPDHTLECDEIVKQLEARQYAAGQLFRTTHAIKNDLPTRPTSDRVDYNFASLKSMSVLYGAFEDTGCLLDLRKAGHKAGEIPHLSMGPLGNLDTLAMIGRGATYSDDGFAGPISNDVVFDLWMSSTQLGFSAHLDDISYLIEHLRENGFTSKDNQFACNDEDDRVHITQHGKGGTLWIDDEGGQYAIQYQNDQDGQPAVFRLARVPESAFGKGGMGISTESEGYLCTFRKCEHDASIFLMEQPARLNDRNFRDTNHIILQLETLQCNLEDDLGMAGPSV